MHSSSAAHLSAESRQPDIDVEATSRLIEAFADAETRLRRRVEFLSQVVFELDATGFVEYVSPAWQRVMGEDPMRCLRTPFRDFLRDEYRQTFDDFLAEPRRRQHTFEAQPSRGETSWARFSITRVPEGGFIGVIDDVSAEQQARSEIEMLSLVARTTDNMVIITDAQGCTTWVNDAFTRRTGYTNHDMAGRTPGSVLQRANTARDVIDRLGRSIRERESVQAEILNFTKHGDPYWVQLDITPVLGASGAVTRFVSIQSDVTQRRAAEEELRARSVSLEERIAERTADLVTARRRAETATNVKSVFLANMSHEIRTPLNAIIGLSSLCLTTDLDTRQRDYLTKVERSAQHVLRIVSEILDMSKVESGMVTLSKSDFSIRKLLEQTEAITLHLAQNRGLALTIACAPTVPAFLVGDDVRLQQVLLNLIGNAVKFTEHGGVDLNVSVEKHDGAHVMLLFSVSDTGVGFPNVLADRLFEPFNQRDNSSSRSAGGTGLGLAISKSIVALMGGEFRVTSTERLGSTFAFTATFAVSNAQDLVRQDEANRDQTERGRARCRGARILVAEDNTLNQQVAQELLLSAGAIVTIAENGAEVIQRLDAGETFDAILMDVQMPVLDGMEATRCIRERQDSSAVPIIATTANATAEARQRCLVIGMNDFVAKPLNPDNLFQVLNRWLERNAVAPIGEASTPAPQRAEEPVTFATRDVHMPSLDLTALETIVGGDPAKVTRLLGVFAATTTQTIAEMNSCVTTGQLAMVARLAHRLRSAAATVGAHRIAHICEVLESTSGAGGADARIVEHIADLQARFAEVEVDVATRRTATDLPS